MTAPLLHINYAGSDAEFALQLAADLRNAGVASWMDRLMLPGTADWSPRIGQSLERAAGMLLVLSQDWFDAEYCQREFALARERRIPLIAVALRPLAEDDYPAGIESRRVIDFSEWRGELTYRERFRRLMARLKDDEAGWVHPPPDDETRYLIHLVARMEAAQGALEYVTTNDQPHGDAELPVRMPPRLSPLWGNSSKIVTLDKVRHAPTAEPRWRRGNAGDIKGALARRPQAVLLGAPGAGKTAVLQRLTLDAARARLADPSLPVPVYINLAHWQEDQDFESFMLTRAPMLRNIIDMAAEGLAILYIDGLNEITQQVTTRVQQVRAWLSSGRAPQRILFACRTRNYDDTLELDIPMLELEPLEDDAIWAILCALVGEGRAERAYLRLMAPESAHPMDAQTRALARNPLLLNGLVFLYKTAPDNTPPTTMGGLLKRWMAAKSVWQRMMAMPGWLPFKDVEAALAKLAFVLIEQDLPTGLPYGDAIKLIGDEKLLRAAQYAGLVEVEADVIAFRQPLLAEYFAAQGVQHYNVSLPKEPPHFNPWGERISTRWDQVLIILAGLAPHADGMINAIAATDPFLAAQVLAGGVEASSEARAAVEKLLVEITNFVTGEGRLAAVRALADMEHPKTLTALLEVTRGGTWQVRQAANWLMHRLPAQLPLSLFEAVRDWNWSMDERVAVTLREVGIDALPLLLQVLRDEQWVRRRGAAWALGEIGDPAAVPGLVEALADDESLVRREAALALRQIKDLDSLPMLVDALRDSDGRVRRAVLDAVIAFKSQALLGLIDLLRDETLVLRLAALEGLAQIGDVQAASAVMPFARHTQIEVRGAAMAALGRMRYGAAVPLLAAALGDTASPPGKQVRLCDVAAGALRLIDTEEARMALRKQTGEVSLMPKEGHGSAAAAKGRLPGRHQAEQQEAGRQQARQAQIADLIDHLYHHDWRMRKRAVESLVESEMSIKVPALLAVLHDEDSQVRLAVLRALDGAQSDAVIWGVGELLKDSEHVVADAAAHFLVQIGQPAVRELMDALLDDDVNVRGRAVEALGEIGEQEAVSLLERLLTDDAVPAMETTPIRVLVQQALDKIAAANGQRDNHRPEVTPVRLEPTETPPVNGHKPSPLDTLELDENSDLILPPDEAGVEQFEYFGYDDLPLEMDTLEEPFVSEIAHQQMAQMLDDLRASDWQQRQEAAKALRQHTHHLGGLTDAVFAECLIATLNDPEHLVRWSATEALAYVRDRSVPPALARMLRDSSWTVRLAAVQALYEHDDTSIVDAVTVALGDENPLVREGTAELLGKLGSEAGVEPLLAALSDREGFVRRAAIDALGVLRARLAVSALLSAMHDPERQVRYAAVEALGKIGDSSAVSALIAVLREGGNTAWDNRPLGEVAAEALEKIGTPLALEAVNAWRKGQKKLASGGHTNSI
jgi:HEAT repeat protein